MTADRCPTCGQYRAPSVLERAVRLAESAEPDTITATDVARSEGVTIETARNTLSTLVAVGRLRRIGRGLYRLPEVGRG